MSNNIDWLQVETVYPDGEPGETRETETRFHLFDLGTFESSRRLSSWSFKVKRYPSSAVLSVSGLRTPQGAAGPNGGEAIARSPKHLQSLVNDMCAGNWEAVFPEEMIQHNVSHSLTSDWFPVRREWEAKTLAVGAALDSMGFSRKAIPWHQYKTMEKEWVKTPRPGLQVESLQHPLLGSLTLEAQLPSGLWACRRSFLTLGEDPWCEARMVIRSNQIGEIIGFEGGQPNPDWAKSSTFLGYAAKTAADPRHINFTAPVLTKEQQGLAAHLLELPEGIHPKIRKIVTGEFTLVESLRSNPKILFYAKRNKVLVPPAVSEIPVSA